MPQHTTITADTCIRSEISEQQLFYYTCMRLPCQEITLSLRVCLSVCLSVYLFIVL